ncbi:Transporter [Rubrivivax sp. A210]|uniref:AEC family transporter n=1 Tax=Rubrivivax sp. A210 TaxID=2772301 RepID=UPI0019C86AA3|nr:AEC family transporter [Rubrivivax sp. A210]CAD5375148.1 Transporter [Rubrivivax sp. A210]
MSLLARIVTIVFPIFLVVMVGFAVGRRQRPEMALVNRLNMQVFLPALIFMALAGRSFELRDNLAIALGAVVVVVVSGLLTWPVALLLGHDPRTLVPPAMFNNVGNMGLPLLLFTFGPSVLGSAVVLMLVVTVAQFTVGPWLLSGRLRPATLWREPLLAAAAAGLVCSLAGVAVWPPLMAAFKLLGDISIGLMIFALGVRLASARLSAWRIGLAGAVVTPLTGMAAAWAFAAAAGLDRHTADILFVFGALPPAVSSFIFAEQYRQEPDKVASIVMMGNVAAILFIPLALALRL